MPPKSNHFSLLNPSVTTEFTDPNRGTTSHIPIYYNASDHSDKKEYVQCTECCSFLPISVERFTTRLTTHMTSKICKKTADRLRRKQAELLVNTEANTVRASIFNRPESIPSGPR